jgi:diguanylate cyclase (GGDEF)-like protein
MDTGDRLEESSGLFSQKMLEILLTHEVLRSRRYPCPVSLINISLQLPKDPSAQIVESAHLVIANLLHAKLRESDLPGHYAGNYLVILPDTNGPGAKVAAERLLATFSGSQITRAAEPFEISISIGVASHPGGDGITVTQLFSDASKALLEAQKRGPKSLVVFEEMQGNTG